MKVYMGIDWSQSKHDLCVLNPAGACLAQLVIAHAQEGFWQIEELRGQLGVSHAECTVGIETTHNLLVDFLWDQGYSPIYLLHPGLVKSSRGRFRQSAARSDPSDALLLAEILRTDQGRLLPWQPDQPLTRQIRVKINFVSFLTDNITRLTNWQRTLLLRYYPVAAELFSLLHSRIAQQFIRAFPSLQAAKELDLATLQAFARQHRYPRTDKLPALLAKLQQATLQAAPTITAACQTEAQALATLLLEMLAARKTLQREIRDLFLQHPDHAIYQSLPGTGAFLQPALLAKFGDDRQRLPTASRVQALAGTSPVTIRSGKRHSVQFRRACDHQFRHIAQQWARLSLRSSVWANAYYAQVRPRCHSDSHAFRCLANRWLAILWRLWQDRVPYDESYHLMQRARRSQPLEIG